MQKTAIVLVNLGTPDAPSTNKVRKFLGEFLNDARVIDLPWLARKILVNLIIVPFRAPKSAKMYQQLWTEQGSPIIFHGNDLLEKFNKLSDGSWKAFLAMRYRVPSLKSVLEQVRQEHYSKLIIVPLFPQYASSTTGSVVEQSMNIIKKWPEIPHIEFISEFYNHPGFINAWIEKIKPYQPENFEHIIFSFHGLPVNQVEMTHHDESCEIHKCKEEINLSNRFCYQAQCYETTRLIAQKLGLEKEKYTLCFQSRFGKSWLNPYADKVIEEKAKAGVKKMLVLPLSFVADCLETNLEIGTEYAELFKENGGGHYQMVESLNAEDFWINALKSIILANKY
ncbi:MAG: ferrochelatase [Bacteroidales bacterium]|nr:ferrochelatase [Bacteroidales bacterium]